MSVYVNVCGTRAIGFYTFLAGCPKTYSCHFRLPEASEMFAWDVVQLVNLDCLAQEPVPLCPHGNRRGWAGLSLGPQSRGGCMWSGVGVPPQAILDVRGIIPSEAWTASVPGSPCRQPALGRFPCSSTPQPMGVQNCYHHM